MDWVEIALVLIAIGGVAAILMARISTCEETFRKWRRAAEKELDDMRDHLKEQLDTLALQVNTMTSHQKEDALLIKKINDDVGHLESNYDRFYKDFLSVEKDVKKLNDKWRSVQIAEAAKVPKKKA